MKLFCFYFTKGGILFDVVEVDVPENKNKIFIKVRLHIWFPHAFSALLCNFLLITLIEQNQGKLKKSQRNAVKACGN